MKKGRDHLLVASALAVIAVAAAAAHTDGAGRVRRRPRRPHGGRDRQVRQDDVHRLGRSHHGRRVLDRRPAAALGAVRRDAVEQASAKPKFKIVQGDTQLPNVAEAIKAAKTLASDKRVLGGRRTGRQPGGPGFVRVVQGGGLAFISGSATRTSLTDGTRKGYFFRVVPNDSVQGPTVGSYIVNKLHAKNVYIIDDQEAYSQGLADTVESYLKAKGVTVSATRSARRRPTSRRRSRRSAAACSRLHPVAAVGQAQASGSSSRRPARARSSSARTASSIRRRSRSPARTTRSSRSTRSRSRWLRTTKATAVTASTSAPPSGVAAGVAMRRSQKACADGKITRAEVRKNIAPTTIPKAQSILGLTVRFTKNGDLKGGKFGDLPDPEQRHVQADRLSPMTATRVRPATVGRTRLCEGSRHPCGE